MFIFKAEQFDQIKSTEVGTKAYNLLDLTNYGFQIPRLVAVHYSAFAHHVTQQDCMKSISEIRDLIMNLNISDDLINEVNQHTEKSKRYAVRSSAIGEDGSEHSFAGQLDTFLNVPAVEVIEKLRLVWLSYFSDHVIAYRRKNNINLESLRLSVVIQEMLKPELSGVAFSMNPVTGDRDEIVISAVYGLGEGLVSGELDADNYRLCCENNKQVIRKEIVEKKVRLVCANDSKSYTEKISIDEGMQNQACLTDDQVREIAYQVVKIAKYYGCPQDIEWAIESNQLYILQSRPVTTLGLNPDKREQRRIWDNSNIIESYSGVTMPLTFSFVDDVYTHVYKQFCRIMGVEERIINSNKTAFKMLGYRNGHIYYNLLNWYKVLSLFPGYSINAAFMEQMMGVKEKISFPPNMVKSNKNEYVRIVKLISMLVGRLFLLTRTIKRFHRLLNITLKPYRKPDFKKDNLDNLKNHYDYLERTLLAEWQAPLINDFFAMIFYGALKKSLQKWNIDQSGGLQNDLLCGEGGIVSTEPVKNIQRIANKVLSNADIKDEFKTFSAKEILTTMQKWPEIAHEIEEHCSAFGDRCFNELKLETITGSQDQSLVIKLIQSYVKAGVSDIETDEGREKKLRKSAEMTLENSLKGHMIRRIWTNFVLRKTRNLVKNRENLRFERTRVYAAVRLIFTEISRRFYAEGIIDYERDIFYLTKEEIFSYIEGTAIQSNLKIIIDRRKIEFTDYMDINMPERFETWGPIYHANPMRMSSVVMCAEGEKMSGIGCSPGIVESEVQLIRDPNNPGDLKDKILVAQHTDPGWTPLFPLSKGILVERGSLLSHSAIVAREMGIPAIVGISNLFQKLKSGDRVRFDGSTGEILLLIKDVSNG